MQRLRENRVHRNEIWDRLSNEEEIGADRDDAGLNGELDSGVCDRIPVSGGGCRRQPETEMERGRMRVGTTKFQQGRRWQQLRLEELLDGELTVAGLQ